MEFAERFEYPLPKLIVEPGKIVAEVKQGDKSNGVLKIRNSGGQSLKGSVCPEDGFISFEATGFEGNSCALEYSICAGEAIAGDILRSRVIVSSNGGEVVVPVVVKVAGLYPEGAPKLRSLAGLAAYARKQPSDAVQFFASRDFEPWLEAIGIEGNNMYSYLRKNNPRLGLESLLVMNRLKHPVRLQAQPRHHEIVEGSVAFVPGSAEIRRLAWGYTEANVRVKHGSGWLLPRKACLTEEDFGEEQTAKFFYDIDPTALAGRRKAADVLLVGDDLEVPIVVKLVPAFVCRLEPAYLTPRARGLVVVENLSGMPAGVSVKASEGFVRLSAPSFVPKMEGGLQLGFGIRLSPIQAAHMVIRKQPTLVATIQIDITQAGRTNTHILPLTVTGF